MLGIVFDISFYLLLPKYDSFKRNLLRKRAMCGRVCRHNIAAKTHRAMCVMSLSLGRDLKSVSHMVSVLKIPKVS